jgi:hypothetical protein
VRRERRLRLVEQVETVAEPRAEEVEEALAE